LTFEEAHYVVKALPEDVKEYIYGNHFYINHLYERGRCSYCYALGSNERDWDKPKEELTACKKRLNEVIELTYTHLGYNLVYTMNNNMETVQAWQK
jgi:hypothetical protein